MLLDYFNALERLKKNKPEIVKKGSKITKASVAREAGRDPAAIKSSRLEFIDLIEAINKAQAERKNPIKDLKEKHDKIKSERDKFKLLYEESLTRELMFVRELDELKREKPSKISVLK